MLQLKWMRKVIFQLDVPHMSAVTKISSNNGWWAWVYSYSENKTPAYLRDTWIGMYSCADLLRWRLPWFHQHYSMRLSEATVMDSPVSAVFEIRYFWNSFGWFGNTHRIFPSAPVNLFFWWECDHRHLLELIFDSCQEISLCLTSWCPSRWPCWVKFHSLKGIQDP